MGTRSTNNGILSGGWVEYRIRKLSKQIKRRQKEMRRLQAMLRRRK